MKILKGNLNLFVFFLGFTLPLNILSNNISIIMLLLYSIANSCYSFRKIRFGNREKFLVITTILFFLLHLIGMSYSSNIKYGLFDIEKKLSLLILPLGIMLNSQIKSSYVETLFFGFVSSVFIICSVCIIHSTYFSIFYDNFQIQNFSRDHLVLPVQHILHPSDLANYCSFSSILLFLWIFKYSEGSKRIALMFINLVLIFTLIFLFARTALFTYFLILIITLGNFLLDKIKSRVKTFFILFILSSAVIIFVINIKPLKERFIETFEDSQDFPYGSHHNSSNLRKANFYCSYSVIRENFWFGVGTGDVQDELDQCYKKNNFSNVLYRDIYNSHNQYLQTMVGIGIPGLLLLILIFFYPLYDAIRNNRLDWIAFFTIIICSALTESILCHQKGIVFFATFYSFYGIKSFRNSEKLN